MGLKRFLKTAETIRHKAEPANESLKEYNHDESNWLVSYADMMTLLCGFFIMLFSMAHLDEPQYEKAKKAIAEQFHGAYQMPNKELAEFVTKVVDESGAKNDTTVIQDSKGVAVVFQSTIFFDSLSSDVKDQGQKILTSLIDAIVAREKNELKKYKIVVEGHTDSRPIIGGIYPSNWELSSARAARVVRMFLDHGFAPDRLTAIGYADTRPIAKARLENGQLDDAVLAKNRRVVLRILDPSVDAIPMAQSAQSAE